MATTESGEGGNIVFEAKDLRLFKTRLSTTANQIGDGGNININTDRLLVLDNSSMTTQAFQGQGGNINISSQVALISGDSLISASSSLGIDGTVNIDAEIFQVEDISILPLKFSSKSLLANSCLTSEKENLVRLTSRGSGGLQQRSQINSFLIPLSDTDTSPSSYVRLPQGRQLARELVKTEDGWKLIGTPDSLNHPSVALSCHF